MTTANRRGRGWGLCALGAALLLAGGAGGVWRGGGGRAVWAGVVWGGRQAQREVQAVLARQPLHMDNPTMSGPYNQVMRLLLDEYGHADSWSRDDAQAVAA